MGAFQATKVDKNELLKLAKDILHKSNSTEALRDDKIDNFNSFHWDKIKAAYDKNKASSSNSLIYNSFLELKHNVKGLNNNRSILQKNKYFNFVVEKKIEDFNNNLNNIFKDKSSVSFDHVSYPEILINITERFISEIGIKAVAVVDETEEFWKSETALKIMRQGSKEISERIFVFKNKEHLIKYLSDLQKWSDFYNVRAISYDSAKLLLRNNNPYDFSIIGKRNDIHGNILAMYHREDPRNSYESLKIRFSAAQENIEKAENRYRILHNASVRIEKELTDERIIDLVFERNKLKKRYSKNIEMSSYIDIEAYDKNEEKHPFYLEMTNYMLDTILKVRNDKNRISILEVGAGTGLFTKQLLNLENADIDCIEVDIECFNILKQRISKSNKKIDSHNLIVKCYNSDSRVYKNKTGKKYDFIVSSFADHHIKPLDQNMYFRNIQYNLKPKGLFIVGDEFLRDHDETNIAEWKNALKDWHNYIISIAINDGNEELAELEKQALNSGLLEIGDFKLSNSEYEGFLFETNFNDFSSNKIGPTIDDGQKDIGGIFVYIIKHNNALQQ